MSPFIPFIMTIRSDYSSVTMCLYFATYETLNSSFLIMARKWGKAQRVARPACANSTLHFLLTDWRWYFQLENDI